MVKTQPKAVYCLFTNTAKRGKLEQRIGLTGLGLQEAYVQAYAHNQAPYGTPEWSPFGWQIGILPSVEDQKRVIQKSRRLTTAVCTRSGRLIPFGTQCVCGCRRWNRRYKKIGGKIKDVRKHKK